MPGRPYGFIFSSVGESERTGPLSDQKILLEVNRDRRAQEANAPSADGQRVSRKVPSPGFHKFGIRSVDANGATENKSGQG
jgi:hypothetical protein